MRTHGLFFVLPLVCGLGFSCSDDGAPTPGELSQDVSANDTGFATWDICADQKAGHICHEGALIRCDNQQVSSLTPCPQGCLETGAGLDDVCLEAPSSGPCAEATDGPVCDGQTLLTCAAGEAVASVPCLMGCDPAGADGLAACAEAPGDPFCGTKSDGGHCLGDALLQCAAGVLVTTDACPFGCLPGGPGGADACAPAPGELCANIDDGAHCEGDALVTCLDGQAVGEETCLHGCIETPGQDQDICGPALTFCGDKPDGSHCQGDTLVSCVGGESQGEIACLLGEAIERDKNAAAIAALKARFKAEMKRGARKNFDLIQTIGSFVGAGQLFK